MAQAPSSYPQGQQWGQPTPYYPEQYNVALYVVGSVVASFGILFLGLAAMYFTGKLKMAIDAGNMTEAENCSKTAKLLIWVGIGFLILPIVLLFLFLTSVGVGMGSLATQL